MPTTPVENAASILRELVIVLENEGNLVAHAHDAAERAESLEEAQVVSEHVLRAVFHPGGPLESLRASINELELGC